MADWLGLVLLEKERRSRESKQSPASTSTKGLLGLGSELIQSLCLSLYHKLGGLNHRHLPLAVLEAGKSKIKMLEDSIPGDSSLAGV